MDLACIVLCRDGKAVLSSLHHDILLFFLSCVLVFFVFVLRFLLLMSIQYCCCCELKHLLFSLEKPGLRLHGFCNFLQTLQSYICRRKPAYALETSTKSKQE